MCTHPARPASTVTKNQAPRSHACQGKKTFVREGQKLEKPLLSQRLPSVICPQRRRAFALHGCNQPFGGTAKLKRRRGKAHITPRSGCSQGTSVLPALPAPLPTLCLSWAS